MLIRLKKTAVILSTFALLNLGSGAALAAEHGHSHHAHGGEEPAQLTLDKGKKWATDNNLRQSMTRIRNVLAAELPRILSGKTTLEQYHVLAQKISDQTAFIVGNCKLNQKADAMLHILLSDIMDGTDAMIAGDGDEPRKGAEHIVHALKNYGDYFAHPGWRDIKLDYTH